MIRDVEGNKVYYLKAFTCRLGFNVARFDEQGNERAFIVWNERLRLLPRFLLLIFPKEAGKGRKNVALWKKIMQKKFLLMYSNFIR